MECWDENLILSKVRVLQTKTYATIENRCGWSVWDSNPLPTDCEPVALPDELTPQNNYKSKSSFTLEIVYAARSTFFPNP